MLRRGSLGHQGPRKCTLYPVGGIGSRVCLWQLKVPHPAPPTPPRKKSFKKIFSPALLVILSTMRWHDPGLRAMDLQKIDAGSIQFWDLAGLMSSALTKDNEYQKQKIMNIKNKQEVKFNLCVMQVALILSTAPHLPNIFNEIRLQFWFLFCYMLKSGIIHIAKFHTYKKEQK